MEHAPENKELSDKRTIVQELNVPRFWSIDLITKLAKKEISKKNLESTEQEETPLIKMDLTNHGLGTIYLKNEGERSINPTGTAKDRLARVYADTYASRASFFIQMIHDDANYTDKIHNMPLERYSLITSGNAGFAIANAFAEKGVPPPKLLLDKKTPPEILNKLKDSKADIYLTDLSVNPFSGKPSSEDPLNAEQILELTNNKGGHDITSANVDYYASSENPGMAAYSSLAAEIFKQNPDEVYVPYGSGMLFEGLVYGQEYRNTTVNIFGAEPEDLNSIADKLTAPAKPFTIFIWGRDWHLNDLKLKKRTGQKTDVYKISEKDLQEALKVIKEKSHTHGVEAEPSAVAGLALYIKRWREGLVSQTAKIIVVSTGKGLEISPH